MFCFFAVRAAVERKQEITEKLLKSYLSGMETGEAGSKGSAGGMKRHFMCHVFTLKNNEFCAMYRKEDGKRADHGR
jgi:hypothetical protein